MSGIVGIGTHRDIAVGRRLRAVFRTCTSPLLGYLHSVRARGGLPVAHAVPAAIVVTAILTWALVTAASAMRPA